MKNGHTISYYVDFDSSKVHILSTDKKVIQTKFNKKNLMNKTDLKTKK